MTRITIFTLDPSQLQERKFKNREDYLFQSTYSEKWKVKAQELSGTVYQLRATVLVICQWPVCTVGDINRLWLNGAIRKICWTPRHRQRLEFKSHQYTRARCVRLPPKWRCGSIQWKAQWNIHVALHTAVIAVGLAAAAKSPSRSNLHADYLCYLNNNCILRCRSGVLNWPINHRKT
jgi:hypothetical protein